jgi:hypothetical protein
MCSVHQRIFQPKPGVEWIGAVQGLKLFELCSFALAEFRFVRSAHFNSLDDEIEVFLVLGSLVNCHISIAIVPFRLVIFRADYTKTFRFGFSFVEHFSSFFKPDAAGVALTALPS